MENEFSVRLATNADRDELTLLKYGIMQNRYQGYLPEKNLSKMDKTYAAGQVDAWMQNHACQVGILFSGNNARGYVACAPDPEFQDWGLILDAGALPSVSYLETEKMLQWANDVLRAKGCQHIHMWLLQDNLRARFMIESFGFKAQKELKLVQIADYTMTERHYIYPETI
ncbi:MAG: hypothetical protein K6A68_11685 [Clostridiales bacterium]|nr:hypothetical protein [Clostridiales bacterium]